MTARLSTPLEDSGLVQIIRDRAIDVITYLDGKPALAIQITTNENETIRKQKMKDMVNRPFIRLSEMTSNDQAIPRTLVYIDSANVQDFLTDHDFANHPKLVKQIIGSNITSLRVDLMKTQDTREQESIFHLISLFEQAAHAFEKPPETIH